MVKKDKLATERKYLKILGLVIMALGLISAIFGVFCMTGAIPEDVVRKALENNPEILKHPIETIRIIYGAGIVIAGVLSFITGLVIKSASKPDNKTTFALVLSIFNIITGATALFSDSDMGTKINSVISVTAFVLAFMAILRIRRVEEED